MPYAKRRRISGYRKRSGASRRGLMSRFTIRRAARRYLRKKRSTRSVVMHKRRAAPLKVPYVASYGKFLRQKLRTTLIYCDTKVVSPGTGDSGHWFNISSIYDPDFTGVGHQPAFHDRWEQLYSKYRVLGAKFYVTFRPRRGIWSVNLTAGGTATGETHPVTDDSHSNQVYLPGIVGYELNNTNSLRFMQASDKNIVREFRNNRLCKIKVTNQNPNAKYSFYGYGSTKMLNSDKDAWLDVTSFGSSPQKSAFLRIGALSKDGTLMADYEFDIKIKFYVELSGPTTGGLEQEN